MKALLGTKIGMTQLLQEDGVVIPITIIQAGPCTVTQVKSVEKDGYSAVQIGFGQGKNLSNAIKGHVKATGLSPKFLREVRLEELPEGLTVGTKLDVSNFTVGELVSVTGVSKGKGFAGNIKRHNFNAAPRSHGAKAYSRRPGSIGSMYPQKVFKGKRMAGNMGNERVTVKNLQVTLVDTERNLIGVKGAVPGPRRGLVAIAQAGGNK